MGSIINDVEERRGGTTWRENVEELRKTGTTKPLSTPHSKPWFCVPVRAPCRCTTLRHPLHGLGVRRPNVELADHPPVRNRERRKDRVSHILGAQHPVAVGALPVPERRVDGAGADSDDPHVVLAHI